VFQLTPLPSGKVHKRWRANVIFRLLSRQESTAGHGDSVSAEFAFIFTLGVVLEFPHPLKNDSINQLGKRDHLDGTKYKQWFYS